MNATNEGVRRSLLVGSLARMQDEDAAERAAGMIDWSSTDGRESFYGPVSADVEAKSESEWSHNKGSGMAQRAFQRLNAIAHRRHRAA